MKNKEEKLGISKWSSEEHGSKCKKTGSNPPPKLEVQSSDTMIRK